MRKEKKTVTGFDCKKSNITIRQQQQSFFGFYESLEVHNG